MAKEPARQLLFQCPGCQQMGLQATDLRWWCGTCGAQYPLTDGIPCLLPRSYDHAVRAHFEQAAAPGGYGAELVGYTSPRVQATVKLACKGLLEHLPAHRLILDAGCGHGFFVQDWARTNTVVGVDLALAMLRLARGVGVNAYQADARHLPFADLQFDLVIAAELLPHVADAHLLVSELVRVTRPGGAIILSSSNKGSLPHKAHETIALRRPSADGVVPLRRDWAELVVMLKNLPCRIERVAVCYLPMPQINYRHEPTEFDQKLASHYVVLLHVTD